MIPQELILSTPHENDITEENLEKIRDEILALIENYPNMKGLHAINILNNCLINAIVGSDFCKCAADIREMLDKAIKCLYLQIDHALGNADLGIVNALTKTILN